MSAIDSKYHIKIGDFGFVLAKMPRAEKHYYTREEAPHFVNKFSSGEPNYRDSTFFPHFVQLNWLNGFNQEYFDDGGKYFRSSGIDVTEALQITLQKAFNSVGQLVAGVNITAQESWRASASSSFGDGSDGALTISVDTTDAPIDSACTGTTGGTSLAATNVGFVAGQKILIVQMQGTGVGNKEENEISNYSTGTITTKNPLAHTYATGAQVLVMKQYTNVTINSGKTLTAKAWDGTVGGIIAFFCNGTLTVTGTITASGKGFRGATTGVGRQGEGSVGPGETISTAANGNGGGGGAAGGCGSGGGHAAAGQSVDSTGGTAVGDVALMALFMGGGGGSGNNGIGGNGGGIIYLFVKEITVAGAITNAGLDGGHGVDWGGGAGAGGSTSVKCLTATLGTALITAAAGTGGTSEGARHAGGNGSVGRIAIAHAGAITGTTTPTFNDTTDGTLSETPAGSDYTDIIGTSNGKVFSWDGAATLTELFDARRLEWFETGTNTDKVVGDTGGTETAQAQGFQVDAACQMKAVQVYLKKAAGTPGNITVTIETDNTAKPSGTKVDATNAVATIPAFTTADYGWITVEFPAAFALAASTTYWIVLKTAAAENDQNYNWAGKTTSGYAAGTAAHSDDGGSTWSADANHDLYFRVLGNPTSVNCMIYSSITSTKIRIGTGSPLATVNGDARLYDYDGTNFTLVKIFATTNESSINCMIEFGSVTTKAYLGLGHKAKVYSTEDWSTFTLVKTITSPNNPGYVLTMAEYNKILYIGGGFPEQLPGNNYQYGGFLVSYDEYNWQNVGFFAHTVITALDIFDNLMFIGTIKKRLYVFNTSSIDKLFEFPWNVKITAFKKWDDKLAIALAPTPGSAVSGHEGIYLFDRNGIHNAFAVDGRSWSSIGVFNNNLIGGNDDGYIYQTSFTTYQSTGYLQTSYDEAQLPSIDKIRRDVALMFDSLPAGCSIKVEYKYDESDVSWITLGTADEDGSKIETYNFASGAYSKKISFRITLSTTVPANTPKLKKIIHKYVLAPDFGYLWKMKLLCSDDLIWLDGTEPQAILGSNITAGATSIGLKSTDKASPTEGFPDPNGATGYATIFDEEGNADIFSYTGKTATRLTGIPATGTYALENHTAGEIVKVTGGNLHQVILDLKQSKELYTFTDIDGLTYTVLFSSFQEDNFIINTEDYWGGIENEVPITLLGA